MNFRNLLVLPLLVFWGPSISWADYGNRFVAGKRLSTVIDSSSKKISYRFTCQEDMTLSAVAVFCLEAVDPPAYRVSLQPDEKGRPSGTPLAFSSVIPRAKSWLTLPMGAPSLLKGNVYHLVIEQDQTRGGDHPVGAIGPGNFASFLSTDVLNHLHPNDGSPDPQSNTLFQEKDGWKELNQEPVYAVYGLGSRFQGNPYDDPGVRPIFGNSPSKDRSHQVLQGEALHFHCGFPATSFVIRVKKQGNPDAPLKVLILKNEFHIHKCFLVHSAVALTAEKAPSDFKWVTIGFDDKSASNFSPECWFIAFQTDSGKESKDPPGCQDCYLLSDVGNSGGLANAANLTFDGGPHLSREIYSLDGGSSMGWLDEFERDVNLEATGYDCPPLQPLEFRPIPTPLPQEYDQGFQK
jgi:hypothetical protein